MALPYPRLELRWRPTREGEYDGYEWACDYVLVLHRATVGDMRSNHYNPETGAERYCAKPVEYLLNTSYRGSTAEPYAGDTPYREGAHAAWDSVALGVPAYSVYKRKSKRLKPNEAQVATVKSRMDGTDTGLRKNRKK